MARRQPPSNPPPSGLQQLSFADLLRQQGEEAIRRQVEEAISEIGKLTGGSRTYKAQDAERAERAVREIEQTEGKLIQYLVEHGIHFSAEQIRQLDDAVARLAIAGLNDYSTSIGRDPRGGDISTYNVKALLSAGLHTNGATGNEIYEVLGAMEVEPQIRRGAVEICSGLQARAYGGQLGNLSAGRMTR